MYNTVKTNSIMCIRGNLSTFSDNIEAIHTEIPVVNLMSLYHKLPFMCYLESYAS